MTSRRTKHVFDSQMTAHVWAQQTQADGRNGNNTLFFHGPTIYSWRESYPIGRIFQAKDFLQAPERDLTSQPTAILLGGTPFSTSTGRHMRYAMDAVRGSHHVIFVGRIPVGYDDDAVHAANMDAWAASIAANVAEARKAATNLAMSDRRHLLAGARDLQRTAAEYAVLFGAPLPDAIVAYDRDAELQAYNLARLGAEQARHEKRQALLLKHGDQLVVREGRELLLADARRAAKMSLRPWLDYREHDRIARAHDDLGEWLGNHPDDATAAKWHGQLAGWIEADRAERERIHAERDAERAREQAARAAAKAMVEAMSREQMIAAIIDHTFPTSQIALVPADVQTEAWRQGASTHPYPSWSASTLLRLKPGRSDVIETSRGAEFPTAHGVRAWRILRQLYQQADAHADVAMVRPQLQPSHLYVRNGATIHLGHFALDRVERDGTVVAGCHRISRAEVERMAATLGLDVLQTSAA